jgi:hypothetical protein
MTIVESNGGSRQALERTIATLLWRLDALERQAKDPEWLRAMVPEVTDTHVALHEARLALHALEPAPVPQTPPATTEPVGRRAVERAGPSHQPSANRYLPED